MPTAMQIVQYKKKKIEYFRWKVEFILQEYQDKDHQPSNLTEIGIQEKMAFKPSHRSSPSATS